MKPTRLNLEDLFVDRYKLEYEESYYAERPEFRKQEEPWLTQIPCQHGHIGVWGDEWLVACTDHAGRVVKRLRELPFTQVAMDGDDGANVLFTVDHFDEVAQIMKPRKRRRLSGEHKARLAASNAKYRFRSASEHAPAAQFCENVSLSV
jgi:hypothetical protein